MKFWKPRHSVCKMCGVHFEPVTGYEARWGNLCSVHRKPVVERDRKRDAVREWASDNWERLYQHMKQEQDETRHAYKANLAAAQQALKTQFGNLYAGQQQAGQQQGLNPAGIGLSDVAIAQIPFGKPPE